MFNEIWPSNFRLVSGVLVVVVQISFAALIFSGDLSPMLSRGLGICLVSAFVVGIIVALRSSIPGIIAMPQDAPAAILAAIVASLFATIPAGMDTEAAYLTTVALIALSSLLAGAVFWFLGFVRQGNIVRYIPFPVVGGFLAGTGWLLLTGSLSVMTGESVKLSTLPNLFSKDQLQLWVPGAIFAISTLLLLRRFSHFLLLPGLILAGLISFFVLLFISGNSISEAASHGWLIGPFESGELWQPMGIESLRLVDWNILIGNIGSVGTIAIVSVVSLLLNASGMEMVARKDLDLDHELRACGLANLAAGLLGTGPTSFHTLSLSALSYKTGEPSRIAGIVSALCCLAALFGGTQLIGYFPKALLGGLLMFLGLSFLVDWLLDARKKLTRANYLIVVLIVVAMNSIGLLEGVGIGFLAAVFLFITDYSRIGAIRRELDCRHLRSNVDRPQAMLDFLTDHGSAIRVFQLQGYLFFGSVNTVVERIKQQVSTVDEIRFVVLDFKRVHGMDASAVFGFSKLLDVLATRNIVMLLASVNETIKNEFDIEEMRRRRNEDWRFETDMDHALETCEDQLLMDFRAITQATESQRTMDLVTAEVSTIELHSGDVLIKANSKPSGVYYLKAGRVAIQRYPSGK